MLVKEGACELRRNRFKALFPGGMLVTIGNMSQLAAATYKTRYGSIRNLEPDWLFVLLGDKETRVLDDVWMESDDGWDSESIERRPDQCAAYGHDLAQITAALQIAPEPK